MAVTWFMSQKTFDGKKPLGFYDLLSVITCGLRSLCRKESQRTEETMGRTYHLSEECELCTRLSISKTISSLIKKANVLLYYELVPYNYSFFYRLNRNIESTITFRQLIAQNREGKDPCLTNCYRK